jgi:predicted dienelactone hydrolase
MSSRLLCVLAAGVVGLGTVPAAGQDPPKAGTPYKPGDGPYQVGWVRMIRLHDDGRGRDVAVKVYFPKAEGRFPVVLFSHGYAGTQDAFGGLSLFWASHGYVCIHPAHPDILLVTKGGGRRLGEREKHLRDPRLITSRVADLKFLLDDLPEVVQKVPAFKGKLDPEHVGVAGHSFGAFTAMLLGGVTLDLPDGERGKSFRDKRVRSVLAIAPQGSEQQGLTAQSFEKVAVPTMTVTGARDVKPGKGLDWRKEPFEHSPPGGKYLVVLQGSAQPASGARANMPPIQEYAKMAGLAFWDTTLKGDQRAQEYLRTGALAAYSNGALRWSAK